MTLDEFITAAKDDNGKPLSDAAFGALCSMSQSQISRLRRRESKPSFEAIQAIHKATGGKVSPNDWFAEAAE